MTTRAYLLNASGVTIPKGSVVKAGTAADDTIVLTAAGGPGAIGVASEAILTGTYGHVVIAGLAEVLIDNAGGCSRGDWIGVSATTAGQGTASTSPINAVVGTAVRARGTAGLVWCEVHLSAAITGATPTSSILTVVLKNSTVATIPKGSVVKADINNDDSIVKTAASDLDPIGIVQNDILAGARGNVIVCGLAEVLVDNVGATAREDWLGVSTTTAGVATAAAIPFPPASDTHFREVGHTLRTRNGPGLVLAIVHFN